jgi:hypothetical protein
MDFIWENIKEEYVWRKILAYLLVLRSVEEKE